MFDTRQCALAGLVVPLHLSKEAVSQSLAVKMASFGEPRNAVIRLTAVLWLMVFIACVAAVKSRPVLHHCVVIFYWSSVIMECTCMLFTFENGVPLMR